MLPITLTQFNRSGTTRKYAILEEDGLYLDLFRMQGRVKIALFELYGYYVEVHYNLSSDQLTKVEAFDNYNLLDPYLSEIDLRPVYSCL